MVSHTHSCSVWTAKSPCHAHGLICNNALFWHTELPIHLYSHLSWDVLSIPHQTATVVSAYPLSWAIVTGVAQRVISCVKSSWPCLILFMWPSCCQRSHQGRAALSSVFFLVHIFFSGYPSQLRMENMMHMVHQFLHKPFGFIFLLLFWLT